MKEDEEVIEVIENQDLKEMTQFHYNQLTYVRPTETTDEYMRRNNVVFPLWQNQVTAISEGIKKQGRVFLADDKVNLNHNIVILGFRKN